MAWLALFPGRLLETVGNGGTRGMIAHDRTRLIGGLPTFSSRFACCVAMITNHFRFVIYLH